MSWSILSAVPLPMVEPISLARMKRQCRVDDTDEFDDELEYLGRAARNHFELYCGLLFAPRQFSLYCDDYNDLKSVPFAPLNKVLSIKVHLKDEIHSDIEISSFSYGVNEFHPEITLDKSTPLPVLSNGSRICLTGDFGLSVIPDDVLHAGLMLIAHWFNVREAVNVGNIVTSVPHSVDNLLANWRRGF